MLKLSEHEEEINNNCKLAVHRKLKSNQRIAYSVWPFVNTKQFEYGLL